MAPSFAFAIPYQLKFHSMRIQQTRENEGDRPYFVTIGFESILFKQGSTRTFIINTEPNDWVGKSEYNPRRNSNGHLLSEQQTNIPWWMGESSFRSFSYVTERNLAEVPIIGFAVIALDNNNTPPNVVRDLLLQVRNNLKGTLLNQVERGQIVTGVNLLNHTAVVNAINERVPQLTNRVLGSLNYNVWDWTFGSTFNPDKIVGANIAVIPGIRDSVTGSSNGSYTLGDDKFNYSTHWGPIGNFQNINWLFEGSGGKYRLFGSLTPFVQPAGNISLIRFTAKSGEDDLRKNSQIEATIWGNGKKHIIQEAFLKRGVPKYSENSVSHTMPPGWKISDILSMDLRKISGKTGPLDSFDNWDMCAIKIEVKIGTRWYPLYLDSDYPVHRFGGIYHIQIQ